MASTTRNTRPAACYATLAAGPIAIAVIAIGALLSGQPVATDMDMAAIGPALAGIVWFSMIAALFALVPNFVGASAMGLLAGRNIGFRHPAMWGLAGAAAAGVPTWLILDSDPEHVWVAGWAAIGAGCALACRATVRWDD